MKRGNPSSLTPLTKEQREKREDRISDRRRKRLAREEMIAEGEEKKVDGEDE